MTNDESKGPAEPIVTGGRELLVVELCVFLAQTVAILIVAVFVTDLLSDEARVTKFVMSKLEANSVKDFFLSLFALTSVMGVIAIVQSFAQGELWSRVSQAILDEFPRTIYFFGANLSALTLVAAIFSMSHPGRNDLGDPVLFLLYSTAGLVFFGYGFALKYFRARKSPRVSNSPS